MKWFRLYHETTTDPKLRRVAHQAGTTMGHVLAVWVSMLSHASANQGDKRGTLAGWDDLDCAINLGIDKAIVYAIRKEMEGRTLDGQHLIAWEQRQYESDSGATRMRRWREKKRQENQDVSPEVTSQQRHGDVSVTAKRRVEESRDEETSVSSSLARTPRSASRADTRGSRLPEDWQPSEDDRAFASGLGLNPVDVAAEFRDFWCAVPGAKGRKLNWSSTFRNRCREVASRRPASRQDKPSKIDWFLDDMKARCA